MLTFYQKNKKKVLEQSKNWKKQNPEKVKIYKRKSRINNPLQGRKDRLKIFNLTLEDYDKMLLKQNYVCAICLKPETVKWRGTLKSLAVDHNHETGEIRGLLCTRCNTEVGVVENKQIRLKVETYLEKYDINPALNSNAEY